MVEVAEEEGSEAAIREHLLNGNARKSVAAFVSIMQGCNQYCTFCIVPYTRGEERSRTIPDIVAECRELVARGVKEITLLGQIVTSYGRALFPARTASPPFVQLLEAVDAIDGLERIRFTSPHPKGYGDDLVEAYGRLAKLAESAHIPVQSGSDRVLKLMHRGYTRERFLGIIEKLRRAKPAIGISTDFIAGFPGETEADFEKTLSLAREVGFDQAFVFKYSQRRDTPAADMPAQVSQAVKEERNQRLLEVVNVQGAQQHQKFVGRQVQILVEGPSKKNPARMMGRTRCNKIVVFDGFAPAPRPAFGSEDSARRHLHALRRSDRTQIAPSPGFRCARPPARATSRLASASPIFHPLPAITEMTLNLSTLSILLGLGMGLPQIYGIVKPAAFAAAVRKFPRSLPWGIALMLLGTVWFLWNLSQESIADFANYKDYLFAGFAGVGLGTCIFVQDFLAVRGLAIVLLLLAKLMVDTGRPALPQTHWVLVIQDVGVSAGCGRPLAHGFAVAPPRFPGLGHRK